MSTSCTDRLVNTFPSSLFIAYQVTPQSQARFGENRAKRCGPCELLGTPGSGLHSKPNDVVNVASEMFWHKLNKGGALSTALLHCPAVGGVGYMGIHGAPWGDPGAVRSVCLPFCHTLGLKEQRQFVWNVLNSKRARGRAMMARSWWHLHADVMNVGCWAAWLLELFVSPAIFA